MDTANKSQRFTFVLVHGGWCSGVVYSELAKILSGRGHTVFTPDLTGIGERSHLQYQGIGLDTNVQDVVNLCRWSDLTDIVLVGHSYGGMVITGVAEVMPERIDSIVYLDAFLPSPGQALIDLVVIPEARQLLMQAKDSGARSVPFPVEFAAALGISDEELWKWAPQPTRTFFDPVASTSSLERIRKRTFVRAEHWPDHEKVIERLAADDSWVTVSVPAGHMLQWEVPKQCADILEKAAA